MNAAIEEKRKSAKDRVDDFISDKKIGEVFDIGDLSGRLKKYKNISGLQCIGHLRGSDRVKSMGKGKWLRIK